MAEPRPACPYAGPRSFRTGETLHGRDREIVELLDLLIAQRIVLLVAPSGAGKSSLVQAGLVPRLVAEGFDVLPSARVSLQEVSPQDLEGGNRYVASLVLSLAQAGPLPEETAGRAGLVGYLDRLREGKRDGAQVLLLDQFEEILTADPLDHAGRVEFFRQLGEALRSKDRWALISLREDHLAGLDPYLRQVPTRLRTRYRLGLLDEAAAMQALVEPARAAGLEFGEEAARHLVDDLRRVRVGTFGGGSEERLGHAVEPLQLQVVATRLWQGLPEGVKRISLEHVADLGRVDEALGAYYADGAAAAARRAGLPERELRAWIERSLITEQGTRGQVLRGEERSAGLPNAAVEALVDAYLLRSEARLGASWLELAHDRMIEPVLADNAAWREAHLSEWQRRAVEWDRCGRAEASLLSDEELSSAAGAGRHELTPAERDFLESSRRKAEERAAQRRQAALVKRLELATTIAAALVAVMAGLGYLRAHQRARAAQLQSAELLSARAIDMLGSRPPRALLLALEACRIAGEWGGGREVETAEHALRQVVHSAGGRPRAIGETDWAAFSASGTRVALVAVAGPLRLRDLAGGADELVLADPEGKAYSVATAALSEDGSVVACVTHDGRVLAWLLPQGAAVARGERLEAGGARLEAIAARGAGGGGTAAVAFVGDDGLQVRELEGGGTLLAAGGRDRPRITALAFDPTGRFLAVGRANGGLSVASLDGRQAAGPEPAPLRLAELGEPHRQAIRSLLFDPRGERFASAGLDDRCLLWERGEGAADWSERPGTEHLDDVLVLAFSPDGAWLASGGRDGTARLREVDAGEGAAAIVLGGHDGEVIALRFARDPEPEPGGWLLATGSTDNSMRIWSLAMRGERWQQRRGHEADVLAIGLAPGAEGQGRRLSSVSRDGTERAWDWDRIVSQRLRHGDHDGEVHALALLQAGGHDSPLELVGAGRSPALWVATDSSPELVTLGDPGGDGRALAPRAADGSIFAGIGRSLSRAWRGADGAWRQEPLLELDQDISRLALSPDGQLLALGSREGGVDLLPLEGPGGRLETFPVARLSADVTVLAFGPGGDLLATASEGEPLALWSIGAPGPAGERSVGQLCCSTADPVGPAEAVAFGPAGEGDSPAREGLAVAGRDGSVRLLDVPSLRSGRVSGSVRIDFAHVETAVHALAFSPPGGSGEPAALWLASGEQGGLVRVRSLRHPEAPALILRGPRREVVTLAFSPSGAWLGAGSPDGFAWAWYVPPGQLHRQASLEKLREDACAIAGRNLDRREWESFVDDGECRPTCDVLPDACR